MFYDLSLVIIEPKGFFYIKFRAISNILKALSTLKSVFQNHNPSDCNFFAPSVDIVDIPVTTRNTSIWHVLHAGNMNEHLNHHNFHFMPGSEPREKPGSVLIKFT